MTTLRVIGIDPGPQPGLVLMRFGVSTPWWPADVRAIQCDYQTAPDQLRYLLAVGYQGTHTLVGCERFVRGNRSAKAAHPGAVNRTERLIGEFKTAADEWFQAMGHDGRWIMNNASRVKAWAKFERLETAGLLDATKGMTHARDAAKHALFVACNDGRAPDPLSRARQRKGK